MSAVGGPAAGDQGKISQEDLRLLGDIEEKVVDNLNLGFDPKVLEVLDDESADAHEIEQLKNSLEKSITTRMFGMANSLYYGKLHAGSVAGFFEVVLRLGMKPAKTFILVHSIFSLSPARELKVLSAKTFGTLVLARMLAAEMGLKGRELEEVELGSLFQEMGRVIMFLYQSRGGEKLQEGFIERYNPYLGVKIVEKFKLPDFLVGMLTAAHVRFDEASFHLSALTHLARSAVDVSFRRHGRLVIEAPEPSPGYRGRAMPSEVLSEQFAALGLSEFLEVIPTTA